MEHYGNRFDRKGNKPMLDDARRMLNAAPTAVLRDAVGLAALSVAILGAFFLPLFA